MPTKISPRDWETISAYLDEQLSPKERSRLEERLQSNPDLRVALMEMRRTRHLLRSQPRLRAPRNFTLTPEMAGRRATVQAGPRLAPRLYPALRLASAFASLLFVLVLLGDLLTVGGRMANVPADATAVAIQPQAQPTEEPPAAKSADSSAAQEPFMAQEAPEGTVPAEAEQALPAMANPAEAATMTAAPPGAGDTGALANPKLPSPTPTPTSILQSTPTLGEVEEAPPPLPTRGDFAPTPPAAGEAPAIESAPAESARQQPTELASAPTEQPAEEMRSMLAASAYPAAAEPAQPPSSWNAWRLAEIGLGSLALLAGLAALYLRLSRRI